MAHTVFAMRGPYRHQETFARELSTRYLPYRMWNPETKKMEDKLIEFRLSPITLWDACYPKEFRDATHTTLFRDGKGGKLASSHRHPILGMPIKVLQKTMGLKPIEPFDTSKWLPMSFPDGMEIIGIGVRDDYWIEPDGKHVNEKEKSKFAREGI